MRQTTNSRTLVFKVLWIEACDVVVVDGADVLQGVFWPMEGIYVVLLQIAKK